MTLPGSALSDGRVLGPSVQRASTIFFNDLDALEAAGQRRFDVPYYGRYGTETTFELEKVISSMENADKAYAVSSGHAAIAAAALAFLSAGDGLLVPTSAYAPTKHLATEFLGRFGISVDFYSARAAQDIVSYCKPQTRVIWIEAPCSLTYDIAEISEIVAFAQSRGIVTIADNTWSSSCLFKPLDHGIDVSIVSATKYLSGHADAIAGFISSSTRHRKVLESALTALGPALAPDVAYLVWRGIQSVWVRLDRQAKSAMQIATALSRNAKLREVLYPALPTSENHERWKKYFSGANGLLSFTAAAMSHASVSKFARSLKLIRLGVSWGGVESVIFPTRIDLNSPEPKSEHGTWLFRVSVGLEDPRLLLEDLEQALAQLEPSEAS
ncbi:MULTISPECIES: PLP-dependent aspartate aminotransferase family protein [unclassified Bradyrhizobium]|uniref:trans-sulfuration enzyme family protein n=1 Tax=unclassified Bradyrhizobium TaxID=2631580 RepID=UPI002915E549|nr:MULTISPECIES: PLP-dependent aspartate aminotransferase family protein [unclassified Bradyrhizobium]